MMNPLTRYFHATKSWPAVILLFQIAYWMPKATLSWGGLKWIGKSAADWCEETALTPKQYKSAVARLRQLGLIETSQHWFYGKNITHVRLTEAGTALVVPKGTSGKSTEGPATKSPKGQPITGLTTETYLQEESCVLTHAESPGEDSQGDSGEEYEIEPGIQTNPKAKIKSESEIKTEADGKPENQTSPGNELPPESQVKPGHKGEKKALANSDKPEMALGLEAVWRDTIAEIDGAFVPPLTVKERGQLKQFAKRCPEGKAAQVLEHTLRHWSIFTTTVENDAGLFKTPNSPHVGFLLKYVHLAVADWQHEIKKPKYEPPAKAAPKAEPAPKSFQAIGMPPVIPKKKKKTPEEIAAMKKLIFGD